MFFTSRLHNNLKESSCILLAGLITNEYHAHENKRFHSINLVTPVVQRHLDMCSPSGLGVDSVFGAGVIVVVPVVGEVSGWGTGVVVVVTLSVEERLHIGKKLIGKKQYRLYGFYGIVLG